jgi:RNA polymerase sigma factor (sigma-70 family)
LASDRLDSELVARSRTEPALFAEIFDRHHAELYRYLRHRVGRTLAADLAAETFITAFARRAAFRPEGVSVRPWLYGIAHNLLANHIRREKRQLAAYARLGADPLEDPSAQAEFAMADSRADSAAVRARLAPILAGMHPGDRDVLLLVAWADLSYAEVAQALNIPVGTVRSRLNRARRQLRVLAETESLDTLLEERSG